ncbi:uvrA [Bradyrhizobium diazoefficiens USDA 110]|uniref:UvrABC system protein A n=1 Tax=Bradyrhizobium diazoefficiens (strain JCM 10833 / BCRC 13528 / IAM 13628 / NBRC 14792 / USDA 110) TaxID=224911 RepID=Q89BU7_BRADU|nr:excinuclease ABC subunit UvrA [Bradyrhizobium diazoefficiens]AND92904.1 excinuclease ABC subunit A [Bradyrhizobium diazoefficiens USDA 110]QBP26778.1 excinuclease ABC subunit A [Bradyrhizobium diazoefficiens]BAC53316.1 uvrA [Bradyrhizobium diazoefficiens USDA 110]BCF48091.1 UvrABC system protein A [Bradyrhizobium diazoefficiens]BCF74252.1 UvrABC system protein A [Bradyrhizobium diazoefficiens]
MNKLVSSVGRRDIEDGGLVRVRGAREHNLKDVSVEIPRNALVVFTGVSGSGKSSLAFGTLYAEAQRRYLESVSPYARRLFHQMAVPEVDSVEGLPPAVALQQQRGSPTTRSSVGSVTTLSNLLRMLYSRAGDYPRKQPLLYAESFSPNTPEGACPTCHGIGRIHEVSERTLVPDDSLTIRERAVAAWPTAWQGQNLRDILVTLGYDVDRPWRELPKRDRDWILFTDEQPTVPVYAGYTAAETKRALKRKEEPSYQGTFTGARKYVLQTFATTQSAMMKRRVSRFLSSSDCPVCKGKRLKPEALSVTFAGMDIADISRLPLKGFNELLRSHALSGGAASGDHPEKVLVIRRIVEDMLARLDVLLDLGLGYLTSERSTPTLSPGELQRLRLATQVRSNLFGVVYVLDEPSAGLHPADTEALLRALDRLKAAGNSLFVVEHELDVVRRADWIVDVGPGAGEHGGQILYSGPLSGLADVKASRTRLYLFGEAEKRIRKTRSAANWLKLRGVARNNLDSVDVDIPLGVFTCVTGISGSGKSSLISQFLVDTISDGLGQRVDVIDDDDGLEAPIETLGGEITEGFDQIKRLVVVDQKPIGRTPRSNLATYTGLLDHVRKLFASTKQARVRHYDAGRFSFNVAKGRCETCQGEGFVCVELLFLPSVYAPCPTCKGARYNAKTLEIKIRGNSIADVLRMTVDGAFEFFSADESLRRSLGVLSEVGLGYIRLGQSATELSGGEAQRVKLATELQRAQRGGTIYVLDEPTTGLHPSDVAKLMKQLGGLVEAGNTVVVVEHDMSVAAASDWIIDIGPGAGDEGGKIVAVGTPEQVAADSRSRTARYLADCIGGSLDRS